MDIENLTSFPVVVINSLLTLLKANHIDINSVVMQLSSDKDEDINLGELTQQTLNELQKAKAQKVAVPEGFVLVEKQQIVQLMANMDSFGKKALGDDYVSFADIEAVLDEAQESAND